MNANLGHLIMPFTSAAFSANGRLPTEEQTQEALEKSFRDVVREDLHRDSAYQPPSVGAPRSVGRNGWLNEIPISAPPGIDIIDRLVDASLPHAQLHGVGQLRGVDPKRVRAKLEQALAKGKISRTQVDAVMSSLPKPDAARREAKDETQL